MDKNIPDKWIRKAIYTAINNMTVLDQLNNQSLQVPCFDSRVPAENIKNYYVLLTTQTNTVDKRTKCDYNWQSSILLDIVTKYNGSGNSGTRLFSDNILDKARELTNNLVLDASSNLTVIRQTQDFPNDIVSFTPDENVFRKLMRIEFFII
tara:strand:+ start:282 stop:734 length:453 start_codon:yes stop_codon:yes gene_type:complete